MLHGLTKSQRKTLNFIQNFIDKNEYSPSITEIMTARSSTSRGGAHAMVQTLVKRGYVTKGPYSARSYLLTDEAKDLINAKKVSSKAPK
jgi:SOS-response transcriptional repressor LexA